MTPPPSILVLGAGELGSEVIKSLASHQACTNTKVTVLVRSSSLSTEYPEKCARIECYRNVGISLLEGDVVQGSQSQLATLFEPFHTVISCTGMACPPGTQLKITKAILESGVRRFFPWQFGIDYDTIGRNSAQDLFDEQLDVRDLLRSQNATGWVIVSTGMFISFLFEPAFGLVDLDNAMVSAIGSWENRLTVTAPEDIGRAVAELALVDTEEKGVIFVAGDTISMSRLAGVAETLIGKAPEKRLKDSNQLNAELEADPTDVMRKYRGVFGAGIGISWSKNDSFNTRKGMKTVSVDQWAMKNLGKR